MTIFRLGAESFVKVPPEGQFFLSPDLLTKLDKGPNLLM